MIYSRIGEELSFVGGGGDDDDEGESVFDAFASFFHENSRYFPEGDSGSDSTRVQDHAIRVIRALEKLIMRLNCPRKVLYKTYSSSISHTVAAQA